jgi:hypothetical protein
VLHLPYNPKNPPEEPPTGTDRLLWTVAFELRASHQPDAAGYCQSPQCGDRLVVWPCRSVTLADSGLMGAVGWWTSPGPGGVR